MLRRSFRGRLLFTILLVGTMCLTLFGPALAFAAPERGGPPAPVQVWVHGEVLLHDADDAKLPPDAPWRPLAAAAASGDYRIDSLLWGGQLTTATITYSFYAAGAPFGGGETVSPVSDGVKANVRAIMAWYGTMLNRPIIEVVETGETGGHMGQIRFMNSNGPSYAYAYLPSDSAETSVASDVHLNPSYDRLGDTNGFQQPAGMHGYMSLIHEIGHSLGLKHPFDGSPVLPVAEDNTANTVMTYTFTGRSSGSPMVYDHMALQYLYGAPPARTGNDTYQFTSRGVDQYLLASALYINTPNFTKQTIWDTGGVNTLDFSGAPANSGGYHLDLKPGGWLTASGDIVTTTTSKGPTTYFDKGTSLGPNVAVRDVVSSGSGDTLYANSQANTFKDYGSSRVTGADVIYDATSADTIDLSGYTLAQVTQTQTGNDLVLGLGAKGSITVKNYYAGNAPTISFAAATPSLSINDVTVPGVDTASRTATFTVTLSPASAGAVSVQYATANGSAVEPADYAASSESLTFAAGQTSKTVLVTVNGDQFSEAAETFSVNLSAESGATVSKRTGIGTIPAHNQVPTAVASASPTNGTAPLVVNFSSAGSSDPDPDDRPALAYAWNFGDGSTGTGVSATHTYTATGSFTATMTVTDPHGATASKTVAVTVQSSANKKLYVKSIQLSVVSSGRSKQVKALVTLASEDGSAFSAATVNGSWSGVYAGTASGKSGSDGQTTLTTKSFRGSGTERFTVTGVTPPTGYTYDASASVKSAQINL